jgi:NAD(P)-dependent dehydrogenase (short-subunit alcohol dehydrogenase family)
MRPDPCLKNDFLEARMTLAQRTAVITGATGGLGSTLARDLAAQGVNLALLDRDSDKQDALVKDLNLPETRIFSRVVDLLTPAEVNDAADAIAAKFGQIDILLHVVGGWVGGKTLTETSTEDLQFMLNQHVWTSFYIVRAVTPHLIKNGWGRVIMITSPFAVRPSAKGGAYAIAKAGQESLILTLSQEVTRTGVTANLLQAKSIDLKREKVSAPSSENAAWTTPEELSATVQFLLSDAASTINGAKIPVYGSYN